MDWITRYKDHFPALMAGVLLGIGGGWTAAWAMQAERVVMLNQQIDSYRENLAAQARTNESSHQQVLDYQKQLASLEAKHAALENRLSESERTPSLSALIRQLENKISWKKLELRRASDTLVLLDGEGEATASRSGMNDQLERELAQLTKQLDDARRQQLRDARP